MVMRPADKDNGIVILNGDDYTQDQKKELDDSTNYKKLDSDNTESINKGQQAVR